MLSFDFIKNTLLSNNELEAFVFGKGNFGVIEFCLNSKSISNNSCFVAFEGEKNNGNEFLKEAFENGALGCIIDSKYKNFYLNDCSKFHEKTWCLAVKNVKEAYLYLAEKWKELFKGIKSIGITGSVGKTTTKEILGHVLKKAGHIPLITKNSENGIIGLANTLLRLRGHHTIIVCEVGISKIGEMEKLSKALKPDIGVITYVGKAHLTGLKDLKTIAAEKSKLFNYLNNEGFVIINGDCIELTKLQYPGKVITFGQRKTNKVRLSRIVFALNFISGHLSIDEKSSTIRLKSINLGFANSVLAAAGVSTALNIQYELLKEALQEFVPVDGRFNIVKSKIGGFFINDAYNANPESMKTSLVAFEKIDKTKKKLLVIGDMLELGEFSDFEHKKIINFLKNFENRQIFEFSMSYLQKVCPSKKKIWHKTPNNFYF